MKHFTYYNPVKIHFGLRALDSFPTFVQKRKALLLTSSIFTNLGVTDQVKKLIPTLVQTIDNIDTLPTFELLESVYNQAWHTNKLFDVIIALGGGSVIDSAKIISVHDGKKDFSFVEKLTRGGIKNGYKKIPVIAVPTTAGTSSEITPWATAWDMNEKKKYSLQLSDLWCETAIYDPHLTLSMPKHITLQTALDALSHSLESIWNKNANPISIHHAIHAAQKIIDYLPKVLLEPSNIEYRTKIMKASMHAGLAFSNTKTAIAHAMSYYMTINKGVPHGIACSFTLPMIVDAVIRKNTIGCKIEKIFGESSSKPLRMFFKKIDVSTRFEDYGITSQDLQNIKETVGTNPRAKNSIIDVEELFYHTMEENNGKQRHKSC